MDEKIATAMKALEKNNMKPLYAQTKAEVVPLVAGLLQDGDTVTAGGSQSLFETGVIDHLAAGRYRFLNRYAEGLGEEEIDGIYRQAMRADAYFCSSNAVTLAGELYNVDGNANRVCAIAYGPASVILVVGANKLVADLDAAVLRVKTVVAPKICSTRGRNTPCAKTGRCVAADGQSGMAVGNMTAGCAVAGRACCSFLVSGRQRVKDRIKVVLVGEALGW